MKETQSSMCSVSYRSKLREPPGKCWTEARRRREEWRESESSARRPLAVGACPLPCIDGSSTDGVRAPFLRGCSGGEPAMDSSPGGEEDMGVDDEPGVGTSLMVLEPLVAAIEGELGGSGERVK